MTNPVKLKQMISYFRSTEGMPVLTRQQLAVPFYQLFNRMKTSRLLLTVTLFAIAMGLLETIVVVYLRELYYPEGFAFPLRMMKPGILSAELLREAATLIMLVAVGWMAGKNGTTRFGWFIYTFAVWDIFYYVFLRLLLDWPDSFFTWDVLFLIPVTWVGPVLAPLINSATMIILAILIIAGNRKSMFRISGFEWYLLVTGSLVVLIAYTQEYTAYMLQHYGISELAGPAKETVMNYAASFIPEKFNWALFISGSALHWLAAGSYGYRISR